METKLTKSQTETLERLKSGDSIRRTGGANSVTYWRGSMHKVRATTVHALYKAGFIKLRDGCAWELTDKGQAWSPE